MTSIQHKIWLLCGIVLCAMGIIWGLLVYCNQLVLEQYNGILQRYLRMNEASERSQRAVAALNEYMLAPDDEKRRSLDRAVRELRDARAGMAGLLNEENAFLLANHMNLMDSLDDAIRRTVMLSGMDNGDQAAAFFGQAARYAGYISETTLSLIGHELSAYDTFYRGIMEQSREIRKLGFLVLGLVLMVLLAFAWWLSRGITRPIQKLTAAARELSRGRFDRPVEIESNDEIAFLARTFDRMRISINDLFLEIRKKAQLEAELDRKPAASPGKPAAQPAEPDQSPFPVQHAGYAGQEGVPGRGGRNKRPDRKRGVAHAVQPAAARPGGDAAGRSGNGGPVRGDPSA